MTQTIHVVSQKLWAHISAARHVECSNCRPKRTVGRVVNGDNDAGSQDNLLPGLANVDHVDTVGPGLPQVGLHVHLEVLCAEMALRSQEHLNVLLAGVEDGGEVAGGHDVGLALQELDVVERLSRYSRSNFCWRGTQDWRYSRVGD
jgi:hypothetical protein